MISREIETVWKEMKHIFSFMKRYLFSICRLCRRRGRRDVFVQSTKCSNSNEMMKRWVLMVVGET
jgi:hypothetical protein